MTSPLRRRLAAAAVLPAIALAACSDTTEPTSSGTDAASETSAPEPTASGSTGEPAETPAGEPSETAAGTTVPLYWVTDSASGPRLVREFRRVEGDPLTEAARLVMGGGEPTDPDYRTLWPLVEIVDAYPTDGLILVQLANDAFTTRPDGMTDREARLAVQQLVHTLQGVQQARVPVQVKPMTGPPYTLFGLPTDVAFRNASPLRTLNHVNITSPEEGATITGDTVTVTGVANSFEASGPCRLLVGDQEVALEPYQAEGWMEDRLFPFEVELPLTDVSGEAEVRCETDDPSGGAEGTGPHVDTKTITVTP